MSQSSSCPSNEHSIDNLSTKCGYYYHYSLIYPSYLFSFLLSQTIIILVGLSFKKKKVNNNSKFLRIYFKKEKQLPTLLLLLKGIVHQARKTPK